MMSIKIAGCMLVVAVSAIRVNNQEKDQSIFSFPKTSRFFQNEFPKTFKMLFDKDYDTLSPEQQREFEAQMDAFHERTQTFFLSNKFFCFLKNSNTNKLLRISCILCVVLCQK